MNKTDATKEENRTPIDLVLIDLDKTLIDENYELTVSEEKVRSVVQKLNKRGVSVGLCSDSSVVSLRQWSERLNITGPLIAERGAVVWDSKSNTNNIVDAAATDWFLDFRSAFIDIVLRCLQDVTLVVGNATEFIRNRTVFPAMSKHILIINGDRIASFSVYTRKLSKNVMSIQNDADLLKNISLLAEQLLSSFNKKKADLLWDKNPEYGILITHAKTSTKSSGIEFINRSLNTKNIVMVGDTMADYVHLPNVLQFAVKNASQEYKKMCSFVSKQSFTGGVIESLEHIL